MATRNHPTPQEYDEHPADLMEQVQALYPDDAALRQVALTAAARYRRGELTPEQAGVRLAKARRAEAEARAVARMVGTLAVADGGTHAGTAAKMGITRKALLTWLGPR